MDGVTRLERCTCCGAELSAAASSSLIVTSNISKGRAPMMITPASVSPVVRPGRKLGRAVNAEAAGRVHIHIDLRVVAIAGSSLAGTSRAAIS